MKVISLNFFTRLALLIVLTIFVMPSFADAQENGQGFIFSRTTFVGNATCTSPNHASVEFVLSQMGTTSQITNSIGRWSVSTRNAGLVRLNSLNFNGQKVSTPICFDPVTEGIQVTVDDSASYHNFSGPTVFPATTTDLSSMRGYHFRGHIELLPKTVSTPDVTAISPTNGAPSITSPSFIIGTNRISSLFNTSALRGIKVYAIRHSNNALYTEIASASGGTGSRSVNAFRSPQIPDGLYLWTFHQEFNGISNTISTDRSRSWSFTNLPLSAAPDAQSFMIDSQAPATNTRFATNVSSVPPAISTVATTTYQHTVGDPLSGLERSIIYITNSAGTILVAHPTQHRTAGNTYGPTSPVLLSLDVVLQKGVEYRFFVVARDVAGNISTSTTYSYTVPNSFSLPTMDATWISNITSNSANIAARISDNGGLRLILRGSCWSTSMAGLLAACPTQAGSLAAHQNIPYTLYDLKSGMPPNTTIYARGFSSNAAGRAYSPVQVFNTLTSATSTIVGATQPTISTTSVSWISGVSARILTTISNTGGSPITSHGVCWDTSLAGLSARSITIPSSNCILLGSISSSATIPYVATTSFSNLPPDSVIFYRSFVQNAIGITDVYGSFRTSPQYFDFAIGTTRATTTFNSSTNDFNLRVDLNHIDQSSYPNTNVPPQRTIGYKIEVDIGDDGSYDLNYDGTITSGWFTYSTTQFVTFNNVPGGMVRINIEINDTNAPFNETASRRVNNTRNFSYRISESVTSVVDLVSGAGGGSGSIVISDPGMLIIAANPIVRTGQETTISWDTIAPYDMTCTVYGPSGFVRVTFNPSIDGTSGDASSGPINSAQDYLLECVEPLSGDTYQATVRVKTVGVMEEV